MNSSRLPERRNTNTDPYEELSGMNNNESNKMRGSKIVKEKSSLSSWEKAYLATDRIHGRESFLGDSQKTSLATDRNNGVSQQKNSSFHNKSYLKEENPNNSNKNSLQEKIGKNELKNSSNNINILKSSCVNNQKPMKNEENDEINPKYFLKVAKSKSPLKQDYKNYELNAKKNELSNFSKGLAEVLKLI